MIHSPADVPVSSGKIKNCIEFLALVAASVAFWWPPIASTIKLALSTDAYTYILLIVPLSLAMVYLEREPAAVSSSGMQLGMLLLASAILLRLLTAWNRSSSPASLSLSLSVLALVLWWSGSVITCLGLRFWRSHFFAFSLLFLLVPLPGTAVNAATEMLQRSSAVATEALFRIAQVPVYRNGVVLSIPGLDLEVASECSSIRSSTMLIVITLLLAHLFLRSKWRKILLVIAAIPLSVAKNAIRIFTIAELGTRVDPAYLSGRLHHSGGIVFFSFAVILIILLAWVLRRNELRTTLLTSTSS